MQTLAPFLDFDADPYPVIRDGRLVWVIDGYTTSTATRTRRTPTRELAEGTGLGTPFNYVRNSVKAIVNAYNGTVTFYVVDQTDPIVQGLVEGLP